MNTIMEERLAALEKKNAELEKRNAALNGSVERLLNIAAKQAEVSESMNTIIRQHSAQILALTPQAQPSDRM